jgi:hypothetical protein
MRGGATPASHSEKLGRLKRWILGKINPILRGELEREGSGGVEIKARKIGKNGHGRTSP